MTEPSQYFKGRTVQEQMNEVIGYVDTRAAEVATDAIASDVAQVHQDMLDADADAAAAAASAAAAAGTLANAVKKTGEASQSIEGDVNLTTGGLAVAGDAAVQGNFSVIGDCEVGTPVNNTDAANKKYVDDADALKLSITNVGSYAVLLTGNQSPITGTKGFTEPIQGKTVSCYYRNIDSKNGYIKVYTWTQTVQSMLVEIMGNSNNDVGYYTELLVTGISSTKGFVTFIKSAYQNTTQRIEAILTNDGTEFALWIKFVSYRYANISIKRNGRYGTEGQSTGVFTIDGTESLTIPDSSDYTLFVDVTDATS